MEVMIAYCGLNCETCPIHLATIEKDPIVQLEMRMGIAEQCATIYGAVLKAEDITDSDGCRSENGRLFSK